ncbi:MAG: hypothetical protein KDK39_02835, partial [Leptospiraceae bacterium]|nr:hypothetical protein [Leptospiraceae bacterium]
MHGWRLSEPFLVHQIVRKVLALLCCLSLSCLTGCHWFTKAADPEIIELAPEIKTELTLLKERYEAPDCYAATFSIQAKSADASSQSVSGVILADNANQRMKLEFKVPYIGMLLSRLVIIHEQVYLDDVYNQRKQVFPLANFVVGGMNQSSIPLPFYVFQDILYARLPGRIYTGQAQRILAAPELRIAWQAGYEQYKYFFKNRQLQELDYFYQVKERNLYQHVKVKLIGRFGRTIYPAIIRLQSMRMNQSIESEMTLTF